MGRSGGYHHGDLRNALLAATIELVRERGARGFSVSEAARRAGVSPAAPYRHFADRDSMLAAAAQQAFSELEERFVALELASDFTGRAAQIATAYVDFAREDPARFEVLFASGIKKSSHPELLDRAASIQARLENALTPFLPAPEVVSRAAELWTLAHGVAALCVSGNLQHVIAPASFDGLAASSARTWAAGISRPGT